jgi:hypothetical protein
VTTHPAILDAPERTDAAFDRLDASSRRAGLVRCPACDDYLADAHATKRALDATCSALRAETGVR